MIGWLGVVATLLVQVQGTPYIWGGDSPAGTDCSGIVSEITNVATGRPIFGDRFDTHSEERELLARGFVYGTKPGALNVGWNSGHTALTLPDGRAVESGGPFGGGVKVGVGDGAFQRQFDHHMYLPGSGDDATPNTAPDQPDPPPPADAPPPAPDDAPPPDAPPPLPPDGFAPLDMPDDPPPPPGGGQ